MLARSLLQQFEEIKAEARKNGISLEDPEREMNRLQGELELDSNLSEEELRKLKELYGEDFREFLATTDENEVGKLKILDTDIAHKEDEEIEIGQEKGEVGIQKNDTIKTEYVEVVPLVPAEEREGQKLALKDLFHLSSEEKAKLQELIKGSGGRVQVLVHSHFHEYDKNKEDLYQSRKRSIVGRDYLHNRDALIKRSAMPVISFIEAQPGDANDRAMARYKEEYKNAGGGEIYTIRTRFQSPTPLLTVDQKDSLEASETAWNQLTDLFKELGIEHATISGQDLRITRNNKLEGCVARTINELRKRDLDTNVSMITYPQRVPAE